MILEDSVAAALVSENVKPVSESTTATARAPNLEGSDNGELCPIEV